MDHFHKALRDVLQTSEIEKFTIRWTPGHTGITGNELADAAAKEAAKGDTSPPGPELLPAALRFKDRARVLPKSKSARKSHFTKCNKQLHRKVFSSSPRARIANKIDPTLPSPHFLKAVAELPKRHASILLQLRTSHVPLNKHLHRISKVDQPFCPHCPRRVETVLHFLLECPHHETHHVQLRHKLQQKARNIACLLADPKCLKSTLSFVHATGRFKTTHGNLDPPRQPNQPN